jgi:hypothetical protein
MTEPFTGPRWDALADCEHPGGYLRMGDHPDMTGRFVPTDLDPDTLYCTRCERAIEVLAGDPALELNGDRSS